MGGPTHNMTNLRGLRDRTGKRVKQMTKQARAARLQAPKINSRSHRLTATPVSPATREAHHPDHMQNLRHRPKTGCTCPLQGCRDGVSSASTHV